MDGVGLMEGLVGGGRVVLHLLLAQALTASIHMLQTTTTGSGDWQRWQRRLGRRLVCDGRVQMVTHHGANMLGGQR